MRKAVAAGKKKALAATKANSASVSALERPRGVGDDSLQHHVSKRKAVELSSSVCPS
jgi:hypothetical protein